MEEKHGILPLGICKQFVMKLDSAMSDLRDIIADEDICPEDREDFSKMTELLGTMMAVTINIVSKEMDEESFMNENIPMDTIEEYPSTDIIEDIMDTPIE